MLVFVGLIIFITGVRSKSLLDITTHGLDTARDDNSTDLQGTNDSSRQYLGEKEGSVNVSSDQNEDLNNLKIDLINGHFSQSSNSFKRMTTEKEFLDYLSSIPQIESDYPENFQHQPELTSPLMRRETNNWKGLYEFVGPESIIPWGFRSFDRHNRDPYQKNDLDKNSRPENFVEVRNDSLLNRNQKPREMQHNWDLPQYVQKNYYNNFYLAVPTGKQLEKWNGEEAVNFEAEKSRGKFNERKLFRKNDCKKYLQFLKYAFQKLDEEAYYDDDEQYENDGNDHEFAQRGQTQPPFQTHLLGPTLYIDNSGKISQSNLKGNSYQNIEGVSAGPNFTSDLPDDFDFYPTDETDEDLKNPPRDIKSFDEPTKTHSWAYPTDETTKLNTTEVPSERDVPFRSGPEIQRRFGNFETTVVPATEKTHSPESTTNYPPEEVTSEVNHRRSGETDSPSLKSIFTGNVNSTSHPLPNWLTLVDFLTTRTTVSPHSTIWTPHRQPAYIDIINKIHQKTTDVNCNDKMLPCPDTVNVTYPLNGYCNRYVTCESGRAIMRLCSDGLHFNPITKSCDLPHNSICTYACPNPNGIYGIPGDCGGYFVCKNSIPEYRMCPPKMHWDINREKCIFEELSSCPMKCAEKNEIHNYVGDCKAYIVCLQGIPYYHKCPPNMKFGSVSETCIPEHLSSCVNDPRLLVKTLNPNVLCNNILKKFGTKSWCDQFSGDHDSRAFGIG